MDGRSLLTPSPIAFCVLRSGSRNALCVGAPAGDDGRLARRGAARAREDGGSSRTWQVEFHCTRARRGKAEITLEIRLPPRCPPLRADRWDRRDPHGTLDGSSVAIPLPPSARRRRQSRGAAARRSRTNTPRPMAGACSLAVSSSRGWFCPTYCNHWVLGGSTDWPGGLIEPTRNSRKGM